MKNNLISWSLLAFATVIFITSCGNDHKESKFGNTYIHHVDNSGPQPATGEYVNFHYSVRLDDSLVENSWERGEPIVYQMPDMDKILADEGDISPIIDAVSMMSEGDSMTIFNAVSSLPMVPEEFKSFQFVYYEVKLFDIQSEEEYNEIQQEKLAETNKRRAETQAREEAVAAKVQDVLTRYKSGGLSDSLQTTDSGLKYVIHEQGEGAKAEKGSQVKVHYFGVLEEDGTMFDNSFKRGDVFSFSLGVGQVIKGWDEGIALLNEGSKATFFIPSELGYGERGAPPTIPENANLVFYVELIKG